MDESKYCLTHFDTILCWPKTLRGTVAYLPCLEEFKGVHYDVTSKHKSKLFSQILKKYRISYWTSNFLIYFTENASRLCNFDGKWDNYTSYDLCQHVPDPSVIPEFEPGIELPTIVYYTGYTISLVSLTLAVAVFLYFKWA